MLRKAASDRSFKAGVFVRCIKMYDQKFGCFFRVLEVVGAKMRVVGLEAGAKKTNLMLSSSFEHVPPELASVLLLTGRFAFGEGNPSNEMSHLLYEVGSGFGLLSCSVFLDVAFLMKAVDCVCDILHDFSQNMQGADCLAGSTAGPRPSLSRSAPRPP